VLTTSPSTASPSITGTISGVMSATTAAVLLICCNSLQMRASSLSWHTDRFLSETGVFKKTRFAFCVLRFAPMNPAHASAIRSGARSGNLPRGNVHTTHHATPHTTQNVVLVLFPHRIYQQALRTEQSGRACPRQQARLNKLGNVHARAFRVYAQLREVFRGKREAALRWLRASIDTWHWEGVSSQFQMRDGVVLTERWQETPAVQKRLNANVMLLQPSTVRNRQPSIFPQPKRHIS
jgi:hypothetical protein